MRIIKQFKEKKGIIYNAYSWLMELSDRIDEHHLYMIASGIAFNIILYLLPLFLVAIYVVNLIFNVDNVALSLESLLGEFLPPTEASQQMLARIISEVRLIMTHSSVFGIIGIIALLWIASLLISSLRIGLNAIFSLPSKHIFIIYRMKDILLTLIFTVLIILYSYAVPLVSFLQELIVNFFPEGLDFFVSKTLLFFITLGTSFMMFYFIYGFVPNQRQPRFVRVMSTLICATAIELGRHLFAWYIGEVSNYGKFYGTYAVVVSLAVWIYYSSLFILLSAELSKFLYDKRQKAKLRKAASDHNISLYTEKI